MALNWVPLQYVPAVPMGCEIHSPDWRKCAADYIHVARALYNRTTSRTAFARRCPGDSWRILFAESALPVWLGLGPQLPPIGIWKDIRLEGYQNARIEEVRLRQYHRDDQVMIEAEVTIQNWVNVPYQIDLHLVAPDGKIFDAQTKITNEKSCKLQVKIENPQLWWPQWLWFPTALSGPY
jgi:hypothetical protein